MTTHIERPDSAAWLRDELGRFQPDQPAESALTPPWTWYVDPRFLELARSNVFYPAWQPVARGDQLTSPGDCFAGTFMNRPFVITRGSEGTLRAFYNVCAHHAAEVAPNGASCQQELVCPYHGWRYDLNGRLAKAPGLGKQDSFETGDFGLRPISVAEWGPLVFVNFSENPPELATELAPLKSRLDAMGFDHLRFVARRDYVIQCNWMVFVDNYLDGGYHVEAVHPGLAGQLNLEDYKTELFSRFNIQSCDAARRKNDAAEPGVMSTSSGSASSNGSAADFAERIGGGSIYAWLYPNLMINRYGPMMDTNWVIPLSESETLTVFDYYFDPTYLDSLGDEVTRNDFIHRSLAASHQVQEEDIDVCESVQRGLAAQTFPGGRYAATENGAYQFHCLLQRDLLQGIKPSGS